MSVPLYEQVYRYLLDEIKSGRLKSGERVPSEKELAEQFHVSRITSKKALENLMLARVVERIRGKGTFVAQTLPDLENLRPEGEPVLPLQPERPEQPLIGVIIEDFSSSYGLKLLQAIENRCSELQLNMLLKRSYGRREQEEQAIESFVQFGVDGLIVFPVHGDYYNPKLLKLVVDEFPLMLVDRYLKGVAAHCVYTDNRKAAYELTEYLLAHDHSQIAFLSPPLENTSSIDDRLQGFTAALTAHNIQLNSAHYCTTFDGTLPGGIYKEHHVRNNQEELERFLQEHPQITAFLACEYTIALLLRHTLRALDPERAARVEIVCFDHPEELFAPPLFTHIQQDEAAMGRAAVDGLFAQLQEEPLPLQTIVPYSLIRLDRSTLQVS